MCALSEDVSQEHAGGCAGGAGRGEGAGNGPHAVTLLGRRRRHALVCLCRVLVGCAAGVGMCESVGRGGHAGVGLR